MSGCNVLTYKRASFVTMMLDKKMKLDIAYSLSQNLNCLNSRSHRSKRAIYVDCRGWHIALRLELITNMLRA